MIGTVAAPARAVRTGPVDPRLSRYAHGTRSYLVLTVVLGTLTAMALVLQAGLLATVVASAVSDGKDLAALRRPVSLLLIVVLVRAGLAWYAEVAANRSSARVKSELRSALVERVATTGPQVHEGHGTGELTILATHGIDALDGYFSRYLPQLALAVIVPLLVLVVVAQQDWVSAVIIAVTVPLIPVFMALIGMATRHRTNRQLRALQRLSGHFLDVLAGLPTLRVFGRSKAQVQTIRDVTDSYRRTTIGTLRLAFLSSLVLEFLASVAVALVAVSVGLRLLGGHLDLRTALFVLVLAPEAYLPLRLVGSSYHASAEGMAAAAQVFEVLEGPLPARGTCTGVPELAHAPITVDDLQVTYPGRSAPALHLESLTVEPGEVLAVTGASGCGKSTLLGVLLGLVPVTSGAVRVGGVDLATLDLDAWRARIAWVPQRPHLFAASVGDNVRLGRPDASAAEVWRALTDAGLADTVASWPDGLETLLGELGAGISAGERQRVALARAFLRDAPLLLLDEPTANLDGATEAGVIEAVRRLSVGRTVVLVVHRPALLALADQVVDLTAVRVGT